MRQICNGYVYDTKKAIKMAHDSYSYSSDFHHWDETLYVTKNGRFFIAGAGGPLSQWGRPVGNNGRGGSKGIRAVAREEAMEWLERSRISTEDLPEDAIKHLQLTEA